MKCDGNVELRHHKYTCREPNGKFYYYLYNLYCTINASNLESDVKVFTTCKRGATVDNKMEETNEWWCRRVVYAILNTFGGITSGIPNKWWQTSRRGAAVDTRATHLGSR